MPRVGRPWVSHYVSLVYLAQARLNHHAGIAQDRMIAAISKSVNITIEERELAPFCVLGPTLRQGAPCLKRPKTRDLLRWRVKCTNANEGSGTWANNNLSKQRYVTNIKRY
jgi:hypothetical protein